MNSTPIVLEMLELLHYIIFSYDYMDQYRKDKVNFTRTRRLKHCNLGTIPKKGAQNQAP